MMLRRFVSYLVGMFRSLVSALSVLWCGAIPLSMHRSSRSPFSPLLCLVVTWIRLVRPRRVPFTVRSRCLENRDRLTCLLCGYRFKITRLATARLTQTESSYREA